MSQEDQWVRGHHGVANELKASLQYTTWLCLEKNNKTNLWISTAAARISDIGYRSYINLGEIQTQSDVMPNSKISIYFEYTLVFVWIYIIYIYIYIILHKICVFYIFSELSVKDLAPFHNQLCILLVFTHLLCICLIAFFIGCNFKECFLLPHACLLLQSSI